MSFVPMFQYSMDSFRGLGYEQVGFGMSIFRQAERLYKGAAFRFTELPACL